MSETQFMRLRYCPGNMLCHLSEALLDLYTDIVCVFTQPIEKIRVSQAQAIDNQPAQHPGRKCGEKIRPLIFNLEPGQSFQSCPDFVHRQPGRIFRHCGYPVNLSLKGLKIVFCQPQNVDYSVINGKIVVKEGQLTVTDLPVLVEEHNKLSTSLINGD